MKSVLVVLVGLVAFIVLCIPDPLEAIPLIGALDEATATAILLACARYFGWDIARFLAVRVKMKKIPQLMWIKSLRICCLKAERFTLF